MLKRLADYFDANLAVRIAMPSTVPLEDSAGGQPEKREQTQRGLWRNLTANLPED
jgi:hypothetical protein